MLRWRLVDAHRGGVVGRDRVEPGVLHEVGHAENQRGVHRGQQAEQRAVRLEAEQVAHRVPGVEVEGLRRCGRLPVRPAGMVCRAGGGRAAEAGAEAGCASADRAGGAEYGAQDRAARCGGPGGVAFVCGVRHVLSLSRS